MESKFMETMGEGLQIEKRQTDPKPMVRSKSFLQGPTRQSTNKFHELKKKYSPEETQAVV